MKEPETPKRNPTKSLACLGVAAITTATAGGASGTVVGALAATSATQLLGDISANMAPEGLSELAFPRLKKEIRQPSDINNQDLQKALIHAISTGLQATFDNYADQLPLQDKTLLEPLHRKVYQLQEQINLEQFSLSEIDITDDDIKVFVDGYDNHRFSGIIDYLLEKEKFLEAHLAFTTLIREQLGANITKAFAKRLKTDRRVWIAYQRLILKDIQDKQDDILSGQQAAQERLDELLIALELVHDQSGKGEKRFESMWKLSEAVQISFTNSVEGLNEYLGNLDRKISLITHSIKRVESNTEEILQLVRQIKTSQTVPDTQDYGQPYNQHHLDSYLEYLIQEYRQIKLPSITNSNAPRQMPLDQIYIALYVEDELAGLNFQEGKKVVDRVTREHELRQGRSLSEEEREVLKSEILADSQTLRNFDHKVILGQGDQQSFKSLDEVFRDHRTSVILGHPGSGKSTIVKWLTLQLAKTLLDGEIGDPIVVDINAVQITEQDQEGTVELGPARLPILIKIPEYVKYFEEHKGAQRLVDYCGLHLPKLPGVSTEEVKELLWHFISNGNAVVMLDGMDEIVQDRRNQIILQIEEFIKHSLKIDASDRFASSPFEFGGNQVVLTSRIVGYHADPLNSTPPYFYVCQMQRKAVERFCHLWCRDRLDFSAEDLVKAIYNERQPQTRVLATNPLLVTMLAILFEVQNGQLPENRVELYEQSITILSGRWKNLREQIEEGTVQILLERLAYHIHSSASEVITISRLKELVEETLQEAHPGMHITRIETQTKAFLRIVKQDVGLLAERGTNIFHFLHRTFQEYLAARHLIRNSRMAAASIMERVSDPVWREPVVLAVAYANAHWSEDRFNTFVTDLLAADDDLQDLVPRGLLLLSTALPDLNRLSPTLFTRLIRLFLNAYGDREGIGRFEAVKQNLRAIINRIRSSNRSESFNKACKNLLSESQFSTYQWALLHLSAKDRWFREDWIELVTLQLPHDSAAWDFPIDYNLLLTLTDPEKEPVEVASLTMRQWLLKQPISVTERILNSSDWLRLMGALYGGFVYNPLIEEYVDLQRILYRLYQREAENEDQIYQLAVRLDTEAQRYTSFFSSRAGQWHPRYIHRQSLFTKNIIVYLDTGRPATDLIEFFFKHWRNQQLPVEERTEALLGLAALGKNVAKEIYQLEQSSNDPLPAQRFKEHLFRVRRSTFFVLGKFLVQSQQNWGNNDPRWFRQSIYHINATVRGLMAASIYAGLQTPLTSTLANYNLLFADELQGYSQIDPIHLAEREAEFFGGLVQAYDPDRGQTAAQLFDAKGKRMLVDGASHLLNAICAIRYSDAIRSEYNRNWHIADLPFEPKTQREKVILAIQIIHDIPGRYWFIRDFFFYGLYPLCQELGMDRLLIAAMLDCKRTGKLFKDILEKLKLGNQPRHQLIHHFSRTKDALVDFITAFYLTRQKSSPEGLILLDRCYARVSNLVEVAICRSLLNDPNIILSYYSCYIYFPELFARLSGLNKYFASENSFADLTRRKKAVGSVEDQIHVLRFAARHDKESNRSVLINQALDLVPAISSELVRRNLLRLLTEEFPAETRMYPANKWELINQSFTEQLWLNEALDKRYVNLIETSRRVELRADEKAKADENTLTNTQTALTDLSAIGLNLMGAELSRRFSEANRGKNVLEEFSLDYSNSEALRRLLYEYKDGTFLNTKWVSLIDNLVSAKEWEKIELIIGILELRASTDISLVEHWEKSSCRIIQLFFQLLRLESGILSVEGIHSAVEIHQHYGDRLRLRAAISIHGESPDNGNHDRTFFASRVGYPTLYALAEKTVELGYVNAPLSSVFGWFMHNNYVDDPLILEQACLQLDNGTAFEQKVANRVLKNCEAISKEVCTWIFEKLENCTKETGVALLKIISINLARVSFSSELRNADLYNGVMNLYESGKATHVFKHFSATCRSISIDDLGQVLQAIDQGELSYADRKQSLKDRLDDKATYNLIDEEDKNNGTHCFKELKRYGHNSYFHSANFERVRKQIAEAIADSEATIRLLVDIYFEWIQDDLNSHEGNDRVVDYLSGVLASVTEKRPELVMNICQNGVANRLLPRVVTEHRNYVVRFTALELLVHLNIMNPSALQAVAGALQDNQIVFDIARQILPAYAGQFDNKTMQELTKLLTGRSALVSKEMATLFSRLSRQSSLNSELRKRAVQEISSHLRRLLDGTAPAYWIYVFRMNNNVPEKYRRLISTGDLESHFYEELVKLTGIE